MSKTRKIEIVMEIARILLGMVLAYVVALAILLVISDDPVNTIQLFVLGPFSSARRIGSVVNLAIPFTICGLSMCFIYAVNKFNLVAEGIFMVAACVITWVSIVIGDKVPSGLMVPLMYIIAIITGVVFSFIPAYLDKKMKLNVIVVSLMMNSIIGFLCTWILKYKMKDASIAFVGSKETPSSIQLPKIMGTFRIQSGIVVAVICVIVIALLFYKTPYGCKMRLVGSNPEFAKTVGLSVLGISFSAQLISGALAGIAGATEMMGNYNRFIWTTTTGHGFDGLMVAVLAKKNPVLVPIAALFLAYIRIGADVVNTSGDIPTEFISIIQGIIILLVVSEAFLEKTRNRIIFKQAEKDKLSVQA